MFEDIKKEDVNVVTGQGAKPEDMFDRIDPVPDVRSAIQTGRLTPVGGVTPQPGGAPGGRVGPPNPLTNLSQVDEWSTKKSHRGLMVSIVLLLVLGGGAAAYFFFFSGSPVPAPQAPVTNQPAPIDEQPVPTTNEQTVPTNALIDSDGDGLTDAEEQAFGTDPTTMDTDSDSIADKDELNVYQTNPLRSDTDNDGLPDRDELFTWRTDPNNPDSDNDTYLDGAEVQNGYDPNGPGKLPVTDL